MTKLSERDVCTKLITPALVAAGWDVLTQVREEVSFTKGRIIVRGRLVTRGKAKRADYVLYYKHLPIALIEAKDETFSVGAGMQQALDYAATLDIPYVFASNHLVTHEAQPWFLLKPDFLLQFGGKALVLDTKWKRIDQALNNGSDKYGLNQTDFYQLFAYGQRYLPGAGVLLLIYPKTSNFDAPLASFKFSEELTLWVVPFDLDGGCLVGGQVATWLGTASTGSPEH